MKLPVPVILFGGISLLNEISAPMVAPLLPILLTAILGAGPVALGIVEGGADAVAAFMKLWIVAGQTSRHSNVSGWPCSATRCRIYRGR